MADVPYVPIPRLLITGWEEIGAALGVTAVTAEKWAKQFDFPVITFNRTPAISPAMFDLWCAELLKKGKKIKLSYGKE